MTFPASADSLEVRNFTANPNETGLTMELWLGAVDSYGGLSFPFSYACTTSNVTLDSITIDAAAYDKRSSIDNAASSGLILLNNFGEISPAGEPVLYSCRRRRVSSGWFWS